MITHYVIYLLTCGKCKYVGSSNNFKRRLAQHKKQLESNTHANDFLQLEFNKGHKLNHKILKQSYTIFKRQILLDEQRLINRYSNSNEAVASNYTNYSRKEFFMDLTDWVVKNWKVVSCAILLVLIVGFGMSKEQALQIVEFLIWWFGGN